MSLLPCPCCTTQVELATSGAATKVILEEDCYNDGEKTFCANPECPISGYDIPIPVWQAIPRVSDTEALKSKLVLMTAERDALGSELLLVQKSSIAAEKEARAEVERLRDVVCTTATEMNGLRRELERLKENQ